MHSPCAAAVLCNRGWGCCILGMSCNLRQDADVLSLSYECSGIYLLQSELRSQVDVAACLRGCPTLGEADQ